MTGQNCIAYLSQCGRQIVPAYFVFRHLPGAIGLTVYDQRLYAYRNYG
jgi:hypothetical protein